MGSKVTTVMYGVVRISALFVLNTKKSLFTGSKPKGKAKQPKSKAKQVLYGTALSKQTLVRGYLCRANTARSENKR